MKAELNKRAKKLDLAVNKVSVSLPHVMERRHAIGPILRLSSSVAVHSRWARCGLSRAGIPNRAFFTSSFFLHPSNFRPRLWFLAKNKAADAKRGFRDRRKQTLFIDARKLGTLIDRVHRELTTADLEKIKANLESLNLKPQP